MRDTFIVNQVSTFAITIILGLAIGFSYDTLRALKSVVRISRSAQFVVDFCYWLLMTVLVFAALLMSNWGEVRLYVFIGLGIGGVFYTLLVSKPYFTIIAKVLQVLVALLWRIIQPFFCVARKIKQGRVWCSRVISAKAVNGRQAVKKIKSNFSRKKQE